MTTRSMLAVAAVSVAFAAGCGADRSHTLPDTWGDIDTDTGWDSSADPGTDPWADPGTDPTWTCDDYVDTDGDTIADHQEGSSDPDADGFPNSGDHDSDNDGIPDEAEAGDGDLCTGPRDSDADTTPDFLDPDSDNDGVSDADEVAYGTSTTDTDSDDDGVSDLVETAYGSNPLDPADSPHDRGDFVFVVDYMQPPDPAQDTLVFGTDLQFADVYIAIDTSGSMSGEIMNLQDSLQATIVPGITAVIPDVQIGVMRFEDCPDSSCPNYIANLQSVTADIDAVQTALDSVTDVTLCGGEEPYALALYIIALADTSGTSLPAASCPWGYYGYPCFRPGAIPIVIQIGDEPFCEYMFGVPMSGGCQCNPRKTTADAYNALNWIHAKYIGVNTSGVPGPMGPRPAMEEVALYTGSSDGTNLFVFEGNEDGTGLGVEIVDAVGQLANSVPLDISTQLLDSTDWPGESVDATRFVERVVPNAVGGVADPEDPARVCVGGLVTGDFDVDGYQDFFDNVAPGTVVCFDIIARQNNFVPRLPDEPQLFTAVVQVMGDWVTMLDAREIYFLVPPDVHIEIPE